MKKDDKAFNAALDILDLCIEYFIYYSILHDIPREESLTDLQALILKAINETEQEYYYDENDNLQVPEYIDELRDFMLQCHKTTPTD